MIGSADRKYCNAFTRSHDFVFLPGCSSKGERHAHTCRIFFWRSEVNGRKAAQKTEIETKNNPETKREKKLRQKNILPFLSHGARYPDSRVVGPGFDLLGERNTEVNLLAPAGEMQ